MIEQEIIISLNTRVAPDTFLMGFRSPEIAGEAKPGQFVMLRVRRGIDPLLRRPFSICGIGENDLVYIVYRVVGKGTAIMSQTGKGEKLSVMGPLGTGFTFPRIDQTPVLVAGGMGIAPLLFLARAMKIRAMVFLAGFASSRQIIDPDQIGHSSIDISLATDDGSRGYSGTVTDYLAEYLHNQETGRDSITIYSCGPLPMLKKAASTAADFDLPCQVSLETVMACGLGACQGCAIKVLSTEGQLSYRHVCKDGPVFSSSIIDWNCL